MKTHPGQMVMAVILALAVWPVVPTAAENTVKVAVVLARTGPATISDQTGWLAARMAVDDINLKGGVLGHRLELVSIDTHSTPIGAMKAAKTALRSRVSAVIGAGWSSQSLSMAKILQEAGVPMITPSATHPEVTRIGNYIFRVCFTDTFQGKALAKFAYNDLSAISAVVLRNVSESYSMDLAQHFKATYRQLGGKVLWQGDYKTATADFTALLETVNDLRPQVVFIPGYEPDSGKLIRQAGKLGVKARYLGGDGWGREILNLAGRAASDSYYLTHWHPEMPTPGSRELVKAFRKRYPKADYSSLMLPLTFDAFRLLADAMRRAGTLDREQIRNALARTLNFQGIAGPISFDANGDPVSRTASILKIDGENILFYKTISFP